MPRKDCFHARVLILALLIGFSSNQQHPTS
jgi:hypothetical protein